MSNRKSKQPNKPEGDERNLVSAEESLRGMSFEDRLFHIWDRHKLTILGVIVAVVVVVLVVQVVDQMQVANERETQQAYGAAFEDNDALAAFAAANPEHRLAGVAHLNLGHRTYLEGEYAEAASHYKSAAEILEAPYEERALLGLAISQAKADREQDARATLRSVRDNENFMDATRGEAAFHLAILQWSDDNFEEVLDQIEFIQNLFGTTPSYWSTQAAQLRHSIPQLDELAAERAATEGGAAADEAEPANSQG